jgi:indole-3-glycerol phosphate synthase
VSDRVTAGSTLDAILAQTRARLVEDRSRRSLDAVRSAAAQAPPARPFGSALLRPGRVNVIAEHKRRSPSRGPIREDLTPGDVARRYAEAGAAALSVLTDEAFFGGRIEHLVAAREATSLPVLRKDFVVDPWQVYEARSAGADAVLLIVAAVTDVELRGLLGAAADAGLEGLVEVHDGVELERALAAGSRIVGVNNRDLRTLAVTIETSAALAPSIPEDVVAVAESGICSGAEIRLLRGLGYDAFLVGDHLMSQPDPGAALRALLAEAA